MHAVVTVRQHLRLAAQMCRERAARHRAQAVNIGHPSYSEVADAWTTAALKLEAAIDIETQRGIEATGNGRQL